jgi:hypothetical protein
LTKYFQIYGDYHQFTLHLTYNNQEHIYVDYEAALEGRGKRSTSLTRKAIENYVMDREAGFPSKIWNAHTIEVMTFQVQIITG